MKRNSRGQFLKGRHWRQAQSFRFKEWLMENYVNLKRSTGEIAKEFKVTDAAILFWLKKHGIERRTVSEARAIKKWGASGESNPMWNRRGHLNPRWLGGVTPERQGFYRSDAWRRACVTVWKRDKATCQKCGVERKTLGEEATFHIHHIVAFAASKALRAEPTNLVLLCEFCHRFVHSKRNTQREYVLGE